MAGRVSRCGRCGECARCKAAARQRKSWANKTPADKRAFMDARPPAPPRPGRRPKPRDAKKNRAKQAVYYAIKVGKLVRGGCEVCGSTTGVQAHHDDYDKPLDVRWLCRKHHGEEHRIYRPAA